MLHHALGRGGSTEGRELGITGPVRGGGEAVEEPGGAEHQGAGAHRGGETGGQVGVAHPLQHPLVVEEGAGPDPTREHQGIRLGALLEGGIDRHPQDAVVAPDLAPAMPDEGQIDGRDALEDLVGADGVERREAREQGNGHVQSVGHADLLSLPVVRKRRR